MQSKIYKTILSVLILFIAAVTGQVAQAQIGPDLVIQPWPTEPDAYWAETWDEPLFIHGGNDKISDEDVDIFYWDSVGRVKLDRENPDPDIWFGYRVLAIEIDSAIPEFPKNLLDVAVVAAGKIAENDTWVLTLTGGGGSANDSHFSNTDALYGIGNINATRKLSETSSLHIGINYNGNRTFLPDVPLPYAMYQQSIDDKLLFFVGVPRSGVAWHPIEPLVVQAELTLPYNLMLNVSWYFTETWSVFGEYKRTLDGFYLDGRDNDRIFYDLSRASVGVRMQKSWLDARVGVGYAFDQEFSTGFDARKLDTIAEPDDQVLFFFSIQGTF